LGYNTNRKIKNVDSALVRDGRCFGVVEFRKINFKEAKMMLGKKHKATLRGRPISYAHCQFYGKNKRKV